MCRIVVCFVVLLQIVTAALEFVSVPIVYNYIYNYIIYQSNSVIIVLVDV